METVLLIGSGGREHAIAWKLAQSTKVSKIYVAPGNAGIAGVDKVEIVNVDVDDKVLLTKWCQSKNVSLVVVGPEAPLANGVADALQDGGLLCFGPSKMAALIESDKIWAKQLMDTVAVPTARWRQFSAAKDARKFIESDVFNGWVIKASGLAAGKGVTVALAREEALAFVDNLLVDRKFGSAGENIIIEEVLYGDEVSVLAFTDGTEFRLMPSAQDHKRALDGDRGGMTGGMGAYCPCSLLDQSQLAIVARKIFEPVLVELRKRKTPFVGVLYAGLMLTRNGPKVLEFNCRFGDPETEVLMPLLDSDLYEIMKACCTQKLKDLDIKWKTNRSAVTVIMASKGYPESSSKGDVIEGIESASSQPDTLVFHCGTKQQSSNAHAPILTNGGRVLAVVSLAERLSDAVAMATGACSKVRFDGAQFRTDIAHKGIARDILAAGEMTYEKSGVSIDAADNLIDSIKLSAKSTLRSGVCGGIGGFGGLFDVKLAGYNDPLLVSGTDGVGTKLKIAQATCNTSTIGIDLVAMCANDILTHGAEPLYFLDYYATGKLQVKDAANVIEGIAEGCRQAGCALIGGETAEMPGMYEGGDFDLAGFVVGAVERNRLLPLVDTICEGDVLIGLESSGVHSNGYSLVRKVVTQAGLDYNSTAPFAKELNKTLGEVLLEPTKMYVKPILPVLKQSLAKALAHITGGGLTENIPRILNKRLTVELDARTWKIPSVFPWLSATGRISEPQMLRTFNCGVGMVIICSPQNKQNVLNLIPEAKVIGKVLNRQGDEPQVKVLNFGKVLEPLMLPHVKPVITKLMSKKRVAVLISGNGSNLQALIDATKDSTVAEIALVISNKRDAFGLERAERAKIPNKVIEHTAYASREDFERDIDSLLRSSSIDIVCLAGFMRVLTSYFVSRWRGNLLNLHPSLLPAFKGANAIDDALKAGVRVTGCTVHFVEEAVDTGAIIAQASVPVEIGETKETLARKIHEAEHLVFPQALLDLAAGKFRLNLEENRLVCV